MAGQDITKRLQPGQSQPVQVGGDFIFLKFADRPIVVIINGGESSGSRVIMEAGDKYRPGAFQSFEIENTDKANPAQLVMTVGRGDYNRQIVQGEIKSVISLRKADGTLIDDSRAWIEKAVVFRPDTMGVGITRGDLSLTVPFSSTRTGEWNQGQGDSAITYNNYNDFWRLTKDGNIQKMGDALPNLQKNGRSVGWGVPWWNESAGTYQVWAKDSTSEQQWLFNITFRGSNESPIVSELWELNFGNHPVSIGAYVEHTVALPDGRLVFMGRGSPERMYVVSASGQVLASRQYNSYGMTGYNGALLVNDQYGNTLYQFDTSDLSTLDSFAIERNGVTGNLRVAAQFGDVIVAPLVSIDANKFHVIEPETMTNNPVELKENSSGCFFGIIQADIDQFERNPADVTANGDGTYSGAVIAWLLKAHLGYVPENYLDAVYGVEINATEEQKKTGSVSFARAGIADNFKVSNGAVVRVLTDATIYEG